MIGAYPTGQNNSLQLMFAKFATAKNREKFNPLKVTSNGAIRLTTTLRLYKSDSLMGLKPPTFDLHVQLQI